jgi:predicted nucleotidyltransferase
VVRVGYFGSYATGRYGPASDFDVLIEVTTAPSTRRADRADLYRPDLFPVAVEIFVYGSDELERLRREGSSFIAVIDREIRWLL